MRCTELMKAITAAYQRCFLRDPVECICNEANEPAMCSVMGQGGKIDAFFDPLVFTMYQAVGVPDEIEQ